MKKFKWTISTPVIWTSFDGGQLWANNLQEAQAKVEKELSDILLTVNKVLDGDERTKKYSIDMDLSQIEFEEIRGSMFSEIRTEHVDDNGITHIDGYKTADDNEEGTVIGWFFNGTVYWRNNLYSNDEYVQEVIKELKNENKRS